jgi:hypothetical protein
MAWELWSTFSWSARRRSILSLMAWREARIFTEIDPGLLKLLRQAPELAVASAALHGKVRLYPGEGS